MAVGPSLFLGTQPAQFGLVERGIGTIVGPMLSGDLMPSAAMRRAVSKGNLPDAKGLHG